MKSFIITAFENYSVTYVWKPSNSGNFFAVIVGRSRLRGLPVTVRLVIGERTGRESHSFNLITILMLLTTYRNSDHTGCSVSLLPTRAAKID